MEKSVVSIKEVIETLSQLLTHHGFSKVTAEMFRKAKFDHPDASQPLLQLIFDILKHFSSLNLLESSHRMLHLVFILKEVGYSRLSLFWRCADSDGSSSRELLLVLGFLIVNMNILQKLEREACNLPATKLTDNWNSTTPCPKASIREESIDDFLTKVIVYRKKVELTYRALSASLRIFEKVKMNEDQIGQLALLKELNDNSVKLSWTQLSLTDVLLQNNSKLQKQQLVVLKKQTALLKLHMKWLKNEHVFWKWMSSVSEETDSNTNIRQPEATEHSISDMLTLHLLSLSKQNFESIFQKYCGTNGNEFSTTQLNQLIRTFCHNILSRRFDSAKEEIDEHFSGGCSEDFDALEKQLGTLQDHCRTWLVQYANHAFPSLVQLPTPRR